MQNKRGSASGQSLLLTDNMIQLSWITGSDNCQHLVIQGSANRAKMSLRTCRHMLSVFLSLFTKFTLCLCTVWHLLIIDCTKFICLICCVRQYTYWLDPDMLDDLQPVSWVFYTRQHSTRMDADVYIHNWWHYLCHCYHYTACFFILEVSHHAFRPVVWFSCKWVCYTFLL